MTSHDFALSLSYPFLHRNNDTHTYTQTYTHTCLPLIAIKTLARFQLLFIWVAFFQILQSETLKYESLSQPPKTNTSRCLLLYINSRPPVFTKCLFNENCFVSSLSEHLMAHVLLQVPETNRDIWPWKAEPRTKTKEHAHTHMYLHTLAHAHKHFPFQPHWVSSKSRSACN